MTRTKRVVPDLSLIPIWGTDWDYKTLSVDNGEGGGPDQWIRLVNRKSAETVEVRLKDLTWILQEYILRLRRPCSSARR